MDCLLATGGRLIFLSAFSLVVIDYFLTKVDVGLVDEIIFLELPCRAESEALLALLRLILSVLFS